LYFLVLLRVRRKKTAVTIRPGDLHLRRKVVSGVFGVGLSAAIQNLLNVTGMMVLNNFTASYGTVAVAAMGITQKIDQVPLYVLMGLSLGVSPLISYTYASKNFPRMKQTVVFTSTLILTIGTASTIFLLLLSQPITAGFIANPEVVACGARLLNGFCLALPFLCMDFMAVGVFQAVGMGRNALFFAIMRKIILEIPALFILNHFFGLYGLAYAQLAAEVVLCAAAILMLVRLFRQIKSTR